MLPSLRTATTEAYYAQLKAEGKLVPLAKEATCKEWEHWRIIHNRFPYDIAFRVHDLLLPKRIVNTREELTDSELAELHKILAVYIEATYDMLIENTMGKRSVPRHYHIHLASYKATRQEFQL